MNREAQNDRAKLIMHRLVARRLKTEPQLVDHARAVLGTWRATRAQPSSQAWLDAWDRLLQQTVDEIRTEIVRRSQRADWLRVTSPFALVPGLMPEDVSVRMRIWQIAKKGANAPMATSSIQSGH